jgi:hypothetical protein
MRLAMDVALVIRFSILEWLRFRDLVKPEIPAAAARLTGMLNLLASTSHNESLTGLRHWYVHGSAAPACGDAQVRQACSEPAGVDA